VLAGVVLVAVVAVGQLGGRASGTFKNPEIEYPAALIDGATIGKADAPVTLEVYEDFQCPICARYSLTVEPDLVASYVVPGILRIVHHDIAILGNRTPSDESKIAAVGASCAADQDRYWDYSHWVYANQDGENAGGFASDRLTAIAQAAGVDVTNFPACLDAPDRVVAVAQTTGDAGTRGVNATPTLAINGQLLQAGIPPMDTLGRLIEAAAASAAPDGSPPAPDGSPAASPAASPSR
jgi:protein-disulfide isomerase